MLKIPAFANWQNVINSKTLSQKTKICPQVLGVEAALYYVRVNFVILGIDKHVEFGSTLIKRSIFEAMGKFDEIILAEIKSTVEHSIRYYT